MKKSQIAVIIFFLFLVILPAQAQSSDRYNHTGNLSMLRVHDLGIAYGSVNNRLDVEVITKFINKNGYSFGFKMRDNNRLPARQGMLSLLRDAFNNGWRTKITYDIRNGSKNGTIVQVTILK